MIEQISMAVAWAVPSVWGFAALYLVWGTERVAPLPYPFGMGVVAGLMYLTLHEVPLWFPGGVTPELIKLMLLIAAGLIGVEIFIRTIENFDLGHRNGHIARAIMAVSRYFPDPEEYEPAQGDGENHDHRRYPRVAMWPVEQAVGLHKNLRGGEDGEDDETAQDGAQKRE